MIKETIQIQNKFGLHTRAAAKLVAVAKQFESKIELVYQDQIADCKSIMSIILLGASKGVPLTLCITGSDEFEARDAIMDLIKNDFYEKERGE